MCILFLVPLYYQPPHNDDCILINKESSVVTLIQNQQDRYTMVQLNDITTGYHTFQCNFGGQIVKHAKFLKSF